MKNILSALAVLLTATAFASAQERTMYTVPTSSTPSGKSAPGLNCVYGTYDIDPSNPGYGVVLIVNSTCAQPVRVTWLIGKDMPRSKAMEAQGKFYTSLIRTKMNGEPHFFPCPVQFPIAVDSAGNDIYTPTNQWHCERR